MKKKKVHSVQPWEDIVNEVTSSVLGKIDKIITKEEALQYEETLKDEYLCSSPVDILRTSVEYLSDQWENREENLESKLKFKTRELQLAIKRLQEAQEDIEVVQVQLSEITRKEKELKIALKNAKHLQSGLRDSLSEEEECSERLQSQIRNLTALLNGTKASEKQTLKEVETLRREELEYSSKLDNLRIKHEKDKAAQLHKLRHLLNLQVEIRDSVRDVYEGFKKRKIEKRTVGVANEKLKELEELRQQFEDTEKEICCLTPRSQSTKNLFDEQFEQAISLLQKSTGTGRIPRIILTPSVMSENGDKLNENEETARTGTRRSSINDTMSTRARSSGEYVMKLVQGIPVFDGNYAENLHLEVRQFLTGVDYVERQLNGSEDLDNFLMAIKLRFKGRAAARVEYVNFNTIQDIRDHLMNFYVPITTCMDVQAKLMDACQGAREPTIQFMARIESLRTQYKTQLMAKYQDQTDNGATIADDTEDLAILALKRGLREGRTRENLIGQKFDTLDKLIRYVTALERDYKDFADGRSARGDNDIRYRSFGGADWMEDRVANTRQYGDSYGEFRSRAANRRQYMPAYGERNYQQNQRGYNEVSPFTRPRTPDYRNNFVRPQQEEFRGRYDRDNYQGLERQPGGYTQPRTNTYNDVGNMDYQRQSPAAGRSVSFTQDTGPTCYECQTKGHYRKDCPRLRTPTVNINYCRVCQAENHTAEDCPKELKDQIYWMTKKMEAMRTTGNGREQL